MTRAEFDALLAQPDDEHLLTAIWGGIETEIDRHGVHGISTPMLNVHLVLRLLTGCNAELITGYFWVSDLHWVECIEALRATCGEPFAKRMIEIGALFPAGQPPEDPEERSAIVRKLPKEAEERMHELASEFCDEVCEPLLANYVRQNAESFAELSIDPKDL